MLLGLCAALFGVMAFGASGAQAAKWLILNSAGTVSTTPEEGLLGNLQSEIDTSTLILHTEILKVKFLVVCTGVKLIGVGLETEGKLTEGGKVEFTGCKGETNESPNANCTPKAGGGAAGVIITNAGKGQLVLHEGGVGLTKVEPKEAGKPFTTLEMAEACPVGERVQINGVLYIKDCQEGGIGVHRVKHLGEEGPLTDLWATATKNAEHTAHILGSVWFFLTTPHSGLAWGGNAE